MASPSGPLGPVHRLWTMQVDPPSLLSDGAISVRMPTEADIDALAGYAPRAAEHGVWLPTGLLDVDPATWAAWFIRELQLGWTPFGGRYGGGLVAGLVDEPVCAYLNFIPREPHVVELCYGVAPEFRGNNIASRATRLASDWALSVGYEEVQLHIGVEHAESQRVAAKAGFHESQRLTKLVPTTGTSHEDVIYTRSH